VLRFAPEKAPLQRGLRGLFRGRSICNPLWIGKSNRRKRQRRKIPIDKDNYLQTAELSTEQNYNMIDGIKPEESVNPTFGECGG